jgi:zinc transporter 9
MSRLTALGSGLLLGAGLGIIIPECVPSVYLSHAHSDTAYPRGVEAIAESNESGGASGHANFPATTIAVSLLVGFLFMLVTEQLIPGAHSHSGLQIYGSSHLSPKDSTVEFDVDVELGELEQDSARSPHPTTSGSTSAHRSATPRAAAGDGFKIPFSGKGFTLTLGLVLHALSDGLALGSSIVSDTGSQELSLVIFAALVIHKGKAVLRLCCVIGY